MQQKIALAATDSSQERPAVLRIVQQDPAVVHGPIFHSHNPAEESSAEARYMSMRRAGVQHYFKDAMGVDDFLARTEIELCRHGFTGENSIGD